MSSVFAFDKKMNASSVLHLSGFNLTAESVIPAFLFATLSYMVILFCNLTLILTIVLNKSLHQPMHLILLNLPINDLIGSSALFPQLIKEILTNSRRIQYSACVTQAFFIHVYAAGTVFHLAAMAYDRFLAICHPLQYNTVMTNAHIMKLIALVWSSSLVLIGVLFILLLRLDNCRSEISNPYCDNPNLLSLVCGDTTINNVYGLFISVAFANAMVTLLFPLSFIIFSYFSIIVAVLKMTKAEGYHKVLSTCAPQILTTCLYYVPRCVVYITDNLKVKVSPDARIIIALLYSLIPAAVNPLIYCLKTADIKEALMKRFKNRKINIAFKSNTKP
uniref:Olfactory receptor n=1 Tax=Oryzias sinensis TaxID=183150 RepID=A0A8C7XCY7_9TELE